MKAMLLAAGEGRRMQPLTLEQPKPALPVLGRPLLIQTLRWLERSGIDEVVINLHHLPDGVRDVVASAGNDGLPTVHFSHEEEALLGTAGGLRRAARLLRDAGPIVVCNSDFLCDIDLASVLAFHRAANLPATLVVAPARDGYSVVECDERNQVRSLAGEPAVDPSCRVTPRLFTGCHVIDESVLDAIPEQGPSDIVRDVYRPLAADGALGARLHDGFWWEFGSPELYLEGSLQLLGLPDAELLRICPDRDRIQSLDRARVAVGAGVAIRPGTGFRGRVALGFASHIAEEAEIEDSVIMSGAWIGPGCRVRRSIVAAGVELPAASLVEDELVCASDSPEGGLVRTPIR